MTVPTDRAFVNGMTHEERAQYAQDRAYERMQQDGVLPYDGEDENARRARHAAAIAGYQEDRMDDDQLRSLFTYHAPTPGQVEVYRDLRDAAYEFARVIDRLCPAGPDRTASIRKVREAVMTANAAVATDGGHYR